MPGSSEQSIIVNVWVVSDGNQGELLDALVALFERLRRLEGFIDGQILEGVDRMLFVSYATMRSARDRDAAFEDSEVRATMRRIGGIAHPRPHAYTLARSFTPAASEPVASEPPAG